MNHGRLQIIVEQEHQTVAAHYDVEAKPDGGYQSEAKLEAASISQLVAQGYDNKEIAGELYLAEGTVRNQISKILEKLELKDRTQLAVYAVKHGLDE